ncbi:MAG: hypothetical protein FWD81_02390 [Methanomassiliicoccaceae archaeon]|nr:hypothetical protein [Methanomassiliicoccaceae archaeon]
MSEESVPKHDKEAIQIMTEFVEGKMSIEDFKYQYDNNPMIKGNFDIYPNKPLKRDLGYDYIPYIDNLDIKKCSDAADLHGFFMEFLEKNNYPCIPTQEYSEKSIFLLKIQPDWLDILDESFLEEQIISKAPADLSEAKRIKWCKDKIKELFRYDIKPPRWVQGAEWPIVNNKPLVFKKQSREKKDDERVYFHFYDLDTKQETVVTQFY